MLSISLNALFIIVTGEIKGFDCTSFFFNDNDDDDDNDNDDDEDN